MANINDGNRMEDFSMKAIHTDHVPATVGSYIQTIKANGMLYLSGQIVIDSIAEKIVAQMSRGKPSSAIAMWRPY